MKVAFNGLCVENRSGTGRYASCLLRALARLEDGTRYAVLLPGDSPLAAELEGSRRFEVTRLARRSAAGRVAFEARGLGRWIRRSGADCFHAPAFSLPGGCPVPALVTVHDLVFHLFPETIRPLRCLYYRRAFPRALDRARLVLADSRNTARDLRRCFDLEEERLRVVPLGVEQRFFEPPEPRALEALRSRYALPREPFLLALGTLEPRKNLDGLLRVYARLPVEVAPPLVVAGRLGWGVEGLRRQARELGLEGRVWWPGFIEDAELPALYRLARVLVFLSRYEGFGLPPLEAMAAGLPVLAARNSSIPEVTGEAALLVEDGDEAGAAAALAELLGDAAQRDELSRAGRERARQFGWEATARLCVAAYREACAGVDSPGPGRP